MDFKYISKILYLYHFNVSRYTNKVAKTKFAISNWTFRLCMYARLWGVDSLTESGIYVVCYSKMHAGEV